MANNQPLPWYTTGKQLLSEVKPNGMLPATQSPAPSNNERASERQDEPEITTEPATESPAKPTIGDIRQSSINDVWEVQIAPSFKPHPPVVQKSGKERNAASQRQAQLSITTSTNQPLSSPPKALYSSSSARAKPAPYLSYGTPSYQHLPGQPSAASVPTYAPTPRQEAFAAPMEIQKSQNPPQAHLPSRPKTPNGTIIQLPANDEVAKSQRLIGPSKFVDVPRIARWAQYNPEWAEYLRAGGGNEESWWLYLRNSGHKGYKVSGWTEVYEERAREHKRKVEEAHEVAKQWAAGMAKEVQNGSGHQEHPSSERQDSAAPGAADSEIHGTTSGENAGLA